MLASARFQSTHPRRVRPAQAAEWVGLGRFNPRTHAGCDPRRAPVRSAGHAVSIHAPTQGATPTVDLAHGHIPVSIHAPTQGATIGPSRIGAMVGFQSTHPRRVRLCAPCHPNADVGFQSTHPRRVRRLRSCSGRANTSFQSTHPRRVRPDRLRGACHSLHVSIHAPTQGATPTASFPPTRCSHVSIHAPTQGATIAPGGRAGRRFNPRTHAGCDAAQLIGPLTEQEFQSTHPRRVRRWGRSGWPPLAWFQSTHPRRCDAPASPVRPHPARFNPRTHAGCDPGIARLAESVEDVSIHAPTQGATSPASPDRWFRWRFNPRTTQGATGQHDDRRQDPRVSIHAPTQGAT